MFPGTILTKQNNAYMCGSHIGVQRFPGDNLIPI